MLNFTQAHPEEEESFTQEEICDHILVRCWLNCETGRDEPDHCLSKVSAEERQAAAQVLVEQQMIRQDKNEMTLTTVGEARAATLVRRNRLAERLFAVVFNLPDEVVRAQACRLEHEKALTPQAVEGICAFLGHPPTCPHGRPIPPGDCCRLFLKEVRPLVTPLSQGEAGDNYKIVFITPKYHSLLERRAGLGVAPGSKLHLAQKSPSYVLRVAATDVALDRDIADGIYVVQSSD